MKTFQFFSGLAILVLVLWTATVPANADAKSLTGGWIFYQGCLPCYDVGVEPCSESPYRCGGPDLIILLGPGHDNFRYKLIQLL